MAIIYTYPTGIVYGDDRLIVSEMDDQGNPTKNITVAALATFITGTGTGTGTTNTIPLWADGPSGLLGDSLLVQDAGATQVTLTGNFIATGTGDFTGQVTIPLTPVNPTDAASKGYVDTEIAGIPAGLIFQGNWDARNVAEGGASDQGDPDLSNVALQVTGHYYVVTTAGNAAPNGPATTPNSWSVGDWVVFIEQGATDRWEKIDQTFVAGSGLTGQVTFWNSVNTVTGDNDFFWDDANKRLGLGTTTPHFNLQVNETTAATSACIQITNVDIGSTANDGLHLIAGDTGNAYIQNRENGFLSLQTNGTEKMRIEAGGNVGIGTATPDTLLTVEGTTGHISANIRCEDGFNATLGFNGATGLWYEGYVRYLTNTNDMSFATNGTEKMRILDTGEVGIGTDAPTVGLQLGNSVAGETKLAIFNSEGGGEVGLTIQSRTNRAKLRVADNDTSAYVVAEGGISSFGPSADADTTNISVVAGDVGIGTIAPNGKLDIVNPGQGGFEFWPEGTSVAGVNLINNYDRTGGNFVAEETRAESYVWKTSTTARMEIASTGAVQLNTYGAGTFSGTATYDLSVDASGNIIETTGGGAGGPFVPYMSGTDQIARTEGAATYNTSLGFQALQLLAAGGNYNTALGGEAGTSLTTGDQNIAIGYRALASEDTGSNNVAIGQQALEDLNYAGSGYNIAIGADAGRNVSTGIRNTIVGGLAGDALTTGGYNIAIGYLALTTEDAGSYNVAIGNYALQDQDAGDAYNVAVGYAAGQNVSTGTGNTFIGGLSGVSADWAAGIEPIYDLIYL